MKKLMWRRKIDPIGISLYIIKRFRRRRRVKNREGGGGGGGAEAELF